MRTTSKSDLVGTTRGTATRTFNLISHMIQDILTLSFIVRSCLVGWLSDLESYTVHQWGRGGDRGVLLHLVPLPFFLRLSRTLTGIRTPLRLRRYII